MGRAKDIRIAPISAQDARKIICALHYSHKVVNNSQIHLGVFLDGKCGGAMQFGPPLDRRRMLGLVTGTPWNGMMELNRMALADWLPRNGESRALAVAMRILREAYPALQWIVSFADAAQCGDGTIYRAAGFVLTGIRRNTSIWIAPEGSTFSRTSLTDNKSKRQQQQARAIISRTTVTKGGHTAAGGGGASMRQFKDAGFAPLVGFQLRYVYFLDPTARERLTVPILPHARIAEMGAAMYLGHRRAGPTGGGAADQAAEGGSRPTPALQEKPHA